MEDATDLELVCHGMDAIDEIVALIGRAGGALYGREAVTQTQHALQTAALAEAEGAAPALVAAALLHDVGHLLAKPDDEPVRARDDFHERIGGGWLARRFGAAVVEPVRLHVDAKRWLVAAEPGYAATLSPASVRSLALQGGPFAAAAAETFRARPYADDAIRLRRWDDRAKDPAVSTRRLEAYLPLLRSLTI